VSDCALCSAAITAAVSQPAEPPPTITTFRTAALNVGTSGRRKKDKKAA
jgi:hypothetical protein